MIGDMKRGDIFLGYVILILVLSSTEGSAKKVWELVFKVATGGPFGVYNLYTSPGTLNEGNSSIQVLDNSIKEHYKTSYIDSWAERNITKVKLAVYNNSTELAYIIFNGTGSSSTDWLNKARILSSSYVVSEMISTQHFFSIKGDDSVNRRFMISKLYKGCQGDKGWLVLVDAHSSQICDVDDVPAATVFYSPTETFSLYTGFGKAECLGVFIELDKSDSTETVDDCSCQCFFNMTYIAQYDTATLNNRLKNLKKELTIMRRSTAKYIRTKISASDNRPSAAGIGAFLGGGILLGTLGAIVISDIPLIFRHLTGKL